MGHSIENQNQSLSFDEFVTISQNKFMPKYNIFFEHFIDHKDKNLKKSVYTSATFNKI
jgi:hypothetical protein